jgi:dTDP-glucose pyrophosphorylase
MAAGMGRRFGGIKQLEPIGDNGELIIDFSIFDAVRSGFDKVVFVIRREIESDFKEKVFDRLRDTVNCEYIFQETPSTREKPYGTGHAILTAKGVVNEPFCVINADDMYGADGFKEIARYLRNIKSGTLGACVLYPLKNTLSNNGAVSRGVCKICGDKICLIDECHGITKQNADPDAWASMNFLGFNPDIFELLEREFNAFLKTNPSKDAEFGITTALNNLIQSGEIEIKAIKTSGQWIGMTYPKDKDIVLTAVRKLLHNKKYEDFTDRRLWVHRKSHLR